MAAWTDLLNQLAQIPEPGKLAWVKNQYTEALNIVAEKRGGRNVLFYASAFLQKPQIAGTFTQLTPEELNGFMSCMFGMDWSKGLTLILHTPGGATNAAETIVQYLRSKFTDIEVVVPTFCMSAGTMIGLASNRIVMGRQSQLGPIDPQMATGGKYVSAQAIVNQFERAKTEVIGNIALAHAWAPILASLGPALLVEAQNALEYGERMVGGWLATRMFKDDPDADEKGRRIAHYFNDAGTHKSHGRRIDREEARDVGVIIEELESDQGLQDAVLTAYHVVTITFEQTATAKILISNHGQAWVKNATQS